MPDPSPTPSADQRGLDRRLLRAPGQVVFPGGAPVEVRTADISSGGTGITHDAPFPRPGTRGRIRLQVLVDGAATVIESGFELRYTSIAGGQLRSGLQFVAMDRVNAERLARLIVSRPPAAGRGF